MTFIPETPHRQWAILCWFHPWTFWFPFHLFRLAEPVTSSGIFCVSQPQKIHLRGAVFWWICKKMFGNIVCFVLNPPIFFQKEIENSGSPPSLQRPRPLTGARRLKTRQVAGWPSNDVGETMGNPAKSTGKHHLPDIEIATWWSWWVSRIFRHIL